MSILTLHLTCPVCPFLCHHKLYIRGQFLVLLSDGLQEYFKQSGSGLSGLEVYGEVSGCGDPPECLIEELFPRQPRNLQYPCLSSKFWELTLLPTTAISMLEFQILGINSATNNRCSMST